MLAFPILSTKPEIDVTNFKCHLRTYVYIIYFTNINITRER